MRIAITGGIASGKSALLNMLRERGISTVSADAIARDVLWDPQVQASLMRRFDAKEPISPVVLRSLLAQGDDERRSVNRIMHPFIASWIAETDATIFEVPLLFETCMHVSFDAIWVAFCSPETQSKRIQDRYGDASGFRANEWQLDSKVALAFADSVISTDVNLDQSLTSLLQEAKRWQLPLVVS